MTIARGIMLALAGLLVGTVPGQADEDTIRIGVLNDQSGSFADFQGPGSIVAAQMAVEDYGGKAAGHKVEVISADHQNKTDLGAEIARKWLDQGVAMIADVPNSAIALAVSTAVREHNKVLMLSGGGTARLTGDACSPNNVAWTYDTWELGHALGRAVVAQGKKSWFFLTSDYAFGHDLQKQTADAVQKAGGTVLGAVNVPLSTTDFSSFLLQAQTAKPDVLAIGVPGDGLTNSVKQSAEFGLRDKMSLAGFTLTIQNIPALTLQAAQGLLTVNAWYWDQNDTTRAFARRYQQRFSKHQMPNDMQAGVYSSVFAYLKAVDKVGSAADGKAVVAAMKASPIQDPIYGPVTIRADGRAMHPVYLLQAKRPDELKEAWDYFKIVASIPAEQAFRPLGEGQCPLVAAAK